MLRSLVIIQRHLGAGARLKHGMSRTSVVFACQGSLLLPFIGFWGSWVHPPCHRDGYITQVSPKNGPRDWNVSDWFMDRPVKASEEPDWVFLGTIYLAKAMWENALFLLGCAAGRIWVLDRPGPTYPAVGISETLGQAGLSIKFISGFPNDVH